MRNPGKAANLTDEQRAKIVRVYREEGLTMMALAQRFGVSATVIGNVIKAAAEKELAKCA